MCLQCCHEDLGQCSRRCELGPGREHESAHCWTASLIKQRGWSCRRIKLVGVVINCLSVERVVDEVGVASSTLSAPSPRRLVWLSKCNPPIIL